MSAEVGRVRVDEARDRLRTKTKHYSMIFSSHFRVRYDRWIKEVKTHFYSLSLILKSYIYKFHFNLKILISMKLLR